MKLLARAHVWWPRLDQQIADVVRSCTPCQSIRNRPPPVELHPWTWPSHPWQRIHADFAGPFLNTNFLAVVDAHSKWMAVIPMSSITSSKTIQVLRRMFASYGLPEQLVPDNAPQFTSEEFDIFTKGNGIRHIKSATYHPSTNGEAERFVQTFKRSLKAGEAQLGNVKVMLSQFLLSYRNTPHTTTGVAPAELFLKRLLRTRLDIM